MIADMRGRVIDVSLSAARALGMMRSGVVHVQCNDCPNENPGMKAGARDAPLGTSASNDQTRSIAGPGRVRGPLYFVQGLLLTVLTTNPKD